MHIFDSSFLPTFFMSLKTLSPVAVSYKKYSTKKINHLGD